VNLILVRNVLLFSKIFAFDRDASRLSTMQSLLKKTGVNCVSVTHQDFRRIDPRDPKYKDVEYILVDPTCSGSGKTCVVISSSSMYVCTYVQNFLRNLIVKEFLKLMYVCQSYDKNLFLVFFSETQCSSSKVK